MKFVYLHLPKNYTFNTYISREQLAKGVGVRELMKIQETHSHPYFNSLQTIFRKEQCHANIDSTGSTRKSSITWRISCSINKTKKRKIMAKKKKTKTSEKNLILQYTFETESIPEFKREFRQLWEKHFCFPKSRLNDVRVILGTRSTPSVHHLLVKKKPCRALLTKIGDPV